VPDLKRHRLKSPESGSAQCIAAAAAQSTAFVRIIIRTLSLFDDVVALTVGTWQPRNTAYTNCSDTQDNAARAAAAAPQPLWQPIQALDAAGAA
jgi:hypothetical protein